MGILFLYAVYRELLGNCRASIFYSFFIQWISLMKNENFDRADPRCSE